MKKIIIITRESEYPQSCEAYKLYKSQPYSSNYNRIHDYIKNEVFIRIIDTYINDIGNDNYNEFQKKWDPLVVNKGVLPTCNQMYEDDEVMNEFNDYEQNEDNPDSYEHWLKKTIIIPKLDDILKVNTDLSIDNRPYVETSKGKETTIYFVFLNRIFDTFVNGSNEYPVLVAGNRLKFIEAICRDCDVIDDDGNVNSADNILYIHDKEWYISGEERLVLYNGKWDTKYKADAGSDAATLEKWFSTIQVFMHSSTTFDRIKNLEFSFHEADEEKAILDRGYF